MHEHRRQLRDANSRFSDVVRDTERGEVTIGTRHGVDTAVATAWGRLRGRYAARGRTLPVIDSLLVATAFVHDLTRATRNTRDIGDLDVDVVNPYDPTDPA